jgi:hypothetical protein
MSYRIEQEQTYLGKDRWRWATWIEATDPELDRIAKVTWRLHHTFPQPVIEVTDRPRRFKIVLSGWGVFQIRAELELADGGRQQLSHWLQLSYPEVGSAPLRGAPSKETPPDSPERKIQGPRVFLSYGSEDAHLATRVKAAMRDHGFDVRDAAEIAPGEPFKAAVQRMIRESDLVLGLVSSEFASPHVIAELNTAQQSAKPAVAAVGLEVGEVFGLDKGLKRIGLNLAAPGSETELAERLIKEPLKKG